jgi:hypothetical protein
MFVKNHFPTLLSHNRELNIFFDLSEALWDLSAKILHPIILALDQETEFFGLRKILIRRNRSFPVILRLIRYEPGPAIATPLHFDKSALTLHMNSNDSSGDRFLIGPGGRRDISITDLVPIGGRKNETGATHAIVFPGLFLNTIGFDYLPPTPYAALGMPNSQYRHTLVAFWLVPFLISEHLITNVPNRAAS